VDDSFYNLSYGSFAYCESTSRSTFGDSHSKHVIGSYRISNAGYTESTVIASENICDIEL